MSSVGIRSNCATDMSYFINSYARPDIGIDIADERIIVWMMFKMYQRYAREKVNKK
jgi:hypothetical protein